MAEYKNPYPTVDAIVKRPGRKIILVERKRVPLGWALPGGFVDWGESFEDAVKREVKEEVGLRLVKLNQFHTYSSPHRDPRNHVVTTVFVGVGEGDLGTEDIDEINNIKEVTLEEALKLTLVFDHRQILNDYIKYINTGDHPSTYGYNYRWI